jgi:hypothetical protein
MEDLGSLWVGQHYHAPCDEPSVLKKEAADGGAEQLVEDSAV